MITDPISDMLTRIRNAQAVRKSDVLVPFSKIKYSIAKILEAEGYVGAVEESTHNGHPALCIRLKYQRNRPVIRSIKRVSTPGRRVYAKADQLPRVLSDMGVAILSTPNGLMTNKEARARKLGGEIICEIA